MTHSFAENKDRQRFELKANGHVAYATFRRGVGTLYIDYVFAPPELRGSGAAGELMQHIVEVAKKEDLKIMPICSYAVLWLKRHKTNEASPD